MQERLNMTTNYLTIVKMEDSKLNSETKNYKLHRWFKVNSFKIAENDCDFYFVINLDFAVGYFSNT